MEKGKILIVDDDPSFLMVAEKELTQAGYAVVTAQNGKEAVQKVVAESFDVVYTDLVMPILDGVGVCREIKQVRPETEIFLISAHHEKVLRQHLEFLEAGGRDKYLRKPLDKGELLEETDRVMEEIRSR